MSPEEKRDDDIFEVEDVSDAPPPEEFKRPKWLMDLEKQKQKEKEEVELKSGAANAKPPPLAPSAAPKPGPRVPPPSPQAAPRPAPPRAPSPTPTPPSADVRTERPTAQPRADLSRAVDASAADIRTGRPTATAPKTDVLAALQDALAQAEIRKQKGEGTGPDPKLLAALNAAVESAEIKQQKGDNPLPANLAHLEAPGEFDVKMDAEKKLRPHLEALDPGEVEVVKPLPDAEKPKPAPSAVQVASEFQVVQDIHAKHPRSERLKVQKPRKLLGIVDTTFSRFDMGSAAEDELRKLAGDYDVMRRTVPGIKDLAVECKILLEEEDCDIVIACGMVGKMPVDKTCAHEASMAIQWAMLTANRHILEVFVHEDEAKDEPQLAWLMDRRTREHALNAHWFLQEPQKLREQAGQGLRQGFDDAGPVRLP